MKKIILTSTLLLASFISATAQVNNDNIDRPVSNIHVELLGGSNGIGIQYDRRLKGNSGLGYGIGAAYGFAYSSSNLFNFKKNIHYLSLSPRINYLLGKNNSKLELGFGTSLGYQFGTEEYTKREVDHVTNSYKTTNVKEKSNTFNYYFFGNIGYRFQSSHGFMFRAGIAPVFGFEDKHSIKGLGLSPYIGIGMSF